MPAAFKVKIWPNIYPTQNEYKNDLQQHKPNYNDSCLELVAKQRKLDWHLKPQSLHHAPRPDK